MTILSAAKPEPAIAEKKKAAAKARRVVGCMVVPLVEAVPECAEISMAAFWRCFRTATVDIFTIRNGNATAKKRSLPKLSHPLIPPPERELNCRFMVGKDRLK